MSTAKKSQSDSLEEWELKREVAKQHAATVRNEIREEAERLLKRKGRVIQPPSSRGVSRVQQSGVRESNPQYLVDQMNRRNLVLPTGTRQPVFGDFSHSYLYDYFDRMNQVVAVEEAMQSIPSAVRDQFRNDPRLLAQALDDPNWQEYFHKHGLKSLLKREEPVVPPAPAPATPEAKTPPSPLEGA